MNRFYLGCAIFMIKAVDVAAIDQLPWYGDVYAFRSSTSVAYSYFHYVDGARPDRSYPSNNYVAATGIGFTLNEDLDFDLDLEMAQTPRQNFSFRSSALQARYRIYNDIAADPISLVAGVNIRGVSSKSVKDISSPYASYCNFEATAAVGKEYSSLEYWTMRWSVFTALGIATHGYPWIRSLVACEANIKDVHQYGGFIEGYFGLFGKNRVLVDRHHGWGNIQHESIDLGAFYRYQLGLWGALRFSYSCRVFAHNYPEYEQRGVINYEIPFSLF